MASSDSTSGIPGAKPRAVSRHKEFEEQVAFLVAKGTKARIDSVRGEMKAADFMRWAIDLAVAEKLARETR